MLDGALDTYSEGQIGGWVRPRGAGAAPVVTLQGDGVPQPLVLQQAPGPQTMPGSIRFTLPDARIEVLLALLSGRAAVYCGAAASTPDQRTPIKATDGFVKAVCTALAARVNAATGPKAPALSAPDRQTPSPFLMLVGTESADGSTFVGKESQLFLLRGNGNLRGQYAYNNTIPAVATKWAELYARRSEYAAQINARLLNIMIPEKTSSLSHLTPEPMDSPTHLSRYVRSKMNASGLSEWMDVDELITRSGDPLKWWRAIDTHMSPYGSMALARAIASYFEVPEFHLPLNRRLLVSGDIAGRFPGMVEYLDFPDERAVEATGPKMIAMHRPTGGLKGTAWHSHNDRAPVQATVAVFGNSFVGFGHRPYELGWWLCRNYRDVHFLWPNDLDHDVCDRVHPDYVICQTIERFLPVLPTT